MHQKLSWEHKNFYLFSQKRKCATARLKLESWNSSAPNSRLRRTAIERKEGMTTTLIWTRRQWFTSLQLTWLSSNDANKTSLVKKARRVGVYLGRGGHSFLLVLLRSCTVPEDPSATNEWTSEPTNKRFSPANFVYRPARKHEAGWRRRPLRDPCCLRRRWLVAT